MQEIQKIDKNFELAKGMEGDDLAFYDIPHAPFDLYGVFKDEHGFLRMPQDVAESVNPGVKSCNRHTAGGRLRFSTDSSVVEIKVTYSILTHLSHMARTGASGFVLFEERDEGLQYVRILAPDHKAEKGFTARAEVNGERKMRDFIMYFPLYNPVSTLSVGLEKDAKIGHGRLYKDIKPIVYYGSSITHGACASRPDTCYQGWITKWNNVDYINLGFSGSGRGEDTMTDYLSSLDTSLFVCDFNHSKMEFEDFSARHYRLYERYRAIRPDTPILILSKTNLFEYNDNAEREKVIRTTYERAIANGDKNVYFVSGHDMFKDKDIMSLCVDGDHPNEHGFYLMAEKIYAKMCEIDECFR